MFFNLFNYKQKAEENKAKIIKNDVKSFKRLCLKEFKLNISRGKTITFIDFCLNVSHDFQHEIANIVLDELRREHKDIDFSFSFRHCENSYQGIKMVAI